MDLAAGWALSSEHIERYRRDGLVVAPYRLPADMLGQMRASLDKLLDDNAETAPESLICPHIPNGRSHDEKAAAPWLAYATNESILDLVEALIGPDIILWGSQVFCKPAFTGRAVPWHQDSRYWPIRPMAACSVWIAVDAATPENGCMRYIPGSQRGGRLLEHQRSGRRDDVLPEEVHADAFDPSTARDDVLEAGQFSLHDANLVHGSNANRSARRRAGFVIRYMPASSRFERAEGATQEQVGGTFSFARRPIWLVRGQDRAGNDFTVGHGEEFRLVPRVSDDP